MNTDGLDINQKTVIDEINQQLPTVLKMPNPDKSRCLVSLAYEYFNLDMEEDGFKLINQCDPRYFKTHIAEDMKNIKGFDTIVIAIMAKLMYLGYIVDPKTKKGKK